MTTDGGLFGSRRPEGPLPKLVVIGLAWAGFGGVALITALLMSSVGIAVFGVLCVLAGVGLYAGHRARERLEEDELRWRSEPGGFDDLLDDEYDDGHDPDARDDGADRQHATRVMSTAPEDPDADPDDPDRRDHDDIEDAEYTEYVEYEPSPSEQDDGTGYDDEDTAFRRRRDAEWARSARSREDDTQVIEADDDEPDGPDQHDRPDESRDRGNDHDDDRGPDDGARAGSR